MKRKDLLKISGVTGINAQYDENVKRLLSNKSILAFILKSIIEEYKSSTLKEIEDFISPDLHTASIALLPDNLSANSSNSALPRIIGDDAEDSVPGEGRITYDIRFHALAPGTQGDTSIKILFNIEAQKNFYKKYKLVTRGIFYGARMISSQLGTEFYHSEYQNIKKVYSIWICMNVPKKIGNSVCEYKITKHDITGYFPDDKNSYDKLSVIMICLCSKITAPSGSLHHLLLTLLSPTLSATEKKRILLDQFNIAIYPELEKEMNEMCNLSEAIEENGVKKGISIARVSAVHNLMKNLDLSLEKALEALNLSRSDYEKSLRTSR